MTIIEQRREDGTLKGRCDARCYGAKGKKCKCLCGGVNHGTGYGNKLRKQTEILYRKLRRTVPCKNISAPILRSKQGFLFEKIYRG